MIEKQKVADLPETFDGTLFQCTQCGRSITEILACPQQSKGGCVNQTRPATAPQGAFGRGIAILFGLALMLWALYYIAEGDWFLALMVGGIGLLLVLVGIYSLFQKQYYITNSKTGESWHVLSNRVIEYFPFVARPQWAKTPPQPVRPFQFPVSVLSLYLDEMDLLWDKSILPNDNQVATLLTNALLSLDSQGLIRFVHKPKYGVTLRSKTLSRLPVGEYCIRLTKKAAETAVLGELEQEILKKVERWYRYNAKYDPWQMGLPIDTLINTLFRYRGGIRGGDRVEAEYDHRRRTIVHTVISQTYALQIHPTQLEKSLEAASKKAAIQQDIKTLKQFVDDFETADPHFIHNIHQVITTSATSAMVHQVYTTWLRGKER